MGSAPAGQEPTAQLSPAAAARVAAAVPASTRRAYAGDWRRFTAWCQDAGLNALPAAPATLAEYANVLAEQGKRPSTIDRAVASLAAAHRAAGVVAPDRTLAAAVVATYRAERAHPHRKASPVTVTVLRAMVETLDRSTLLGVRDQALLVGGFAMGRRRAELAALDVQDLHFVDAGLEVTIRRSKTDQAAVGAVVVLPYGSNPATCPVRTTRAWLDARAGSGLPADAGPLFVRIDRHGRAGVHARAGRGSRDGRLTGRSIAAIVSRTAAAAADLDPTAVWSGHSLRRGLATEAHRNGAAELRIARHGGWADGSPTLGGYIEEVDRWENNPLLGIGL